MLVERYQTIAFRTAWLVCGDAARPRTPPRRRSSRPTPRSARFRPGRAVAAVAAADRRQRGAQPAALGRAGAPTSRAARRAWPTGPSPTRARGGAARGRAAQRARGRARATRRGASASVVLLRYVLDLSEAECAAVLGCRPGTVKSRASRALDPPARRAGGRRWLSSRPACARSATSPPGRRRPTSPGVRARPRSGRERARRHRRRSVGGAGGRGAAACVAAPLARSRPPCWSLIPAAGAAAFPQARDDVLEWLGLRQTEVRRVPARRRRGRRRRPTSASATTLADGGAAGGLRAARPRRRSGAPDAVHVDAPRRRRADHAGLPAAPRAAGAARRGAPGCSSRRRAGGSTGELLRKIAGPGTDVAQVRGRRRPRRALHRRGARLPLPRPGGPDPRGPPVARRRRRWCSSATARSCASRPPRAARRCGGWPPRCAVSRRRRLTSAAPGQHAVPAVGEHLQLLLGEVAQEALAHAGQVGRAGAREQLRALVGRAPRSSRARPSCRCRAPAARRARAGRRGG